MTDSVTRRRRAQTKASSVEPPEASPPAATGEERSQFLKFLVGVLLGGCFAAAIGLDLFPEEARLERYVERLEEQKRDLETEIAFLRGEIERGRMPLGAAVGMPLGEVPTPAVLLEHLDARRWREFAGGAEVLLRSGEPGFDRLIQVIAGGIGEPFEAFRRSAALFPLLRVVIANEHELDAFLAYLLTSRQFREDRPLREWVLSVGAWLVAGSGETFAASRGALHQCLENQLKTGDSGTWVVLNSLELLEGEIPVESVREILEESKREEVHGYLLKYLGERGDADSVRVIENYIQSRGGEGEWTLVALESLASVRREQAARALDSFLQSKNPALREAAHLAFFSRPRQIDPAMRVLLDFLNSSDSLSARRRVLERIHQKSPRVFLALQERATEVRDAALRALVLNASRPVPATFKNE